jgi:hypothetical protein
MAEKWLPVKGYEGLYEVSDHGRVKRVESRVRTDSQLSESYRVKITSGVF